MAKGQLCWSCTKACGLCPWSHRGEAIPGWKAAKTPKGYLVEKCPEYELDQRAIDWEKSFGYLEDGRRKKRGTKGGVKVPLKATSVHTGEVRFYESFAAAAKDGFYAQKINRVIAGENNSHHGWKFERVEETT